MPDVQRTLEVERVVNIAKGFGWEKIEESLDGNDVKITFKKTIKPGIPEPLGS